MAGTNRFSELMKTYPHAASRRMGPGKNPAVLVVDFIRGFTDSRSPIGGSWQREMDATAELLREAHKRKVPVLFTTVEYNREELASLLLGLKTPGIACLLRGSEWTELDPLLPREPGDLVVSKKYGSAFFATDLATKLIGARVDTVFICGCVTSGCVRASAVDAAQHGFRPMVVREAVGDRSPLAHETNLMDIDLRYGDVVSLEEALAYLRQKGSGSAW